MSSLLSARRSFIAITAFAVPMAFTAISANVAMAGYLYVADTDTTETSDAYVDLPIDAQTVTTEPDHSLFEMSMSNEGGASGNIIEIGITTDPDLNGDSDPHWFVSSWVDGTWQGYDSSSDFVSDAGSFWTTPLTLEEGTSERVNFDYSNGNWDLYINGNAAGYFAGSEWSGAFTDSLVTDVFGEVYQTGTNYPTLNGTVSGYYSLGGGELSTLVVDSPYAQIDASSTGFTALGPVPEPSTWGMMAAGVTSLFVFRRRSLDFLVARVRESRNCNTTETASIVRQL